MRLNKQNMKNKIRETEIILKSLKNINISLIMRSIEGRLAIKTAKTNFRGYHFGFLNIYLFVIQKFKFRY